MTGKTVAVIDYNMCNLDSVARALRECGANPVVTDDPSTISAADAIVLPGVGAFATGMRNLHRKDLPAVLDEAVVDRGVPTLGICLGMQLMARIGREGAATEGLGWLDGEVVPLVATSARERVPHVGWNEIHVKESDPLVARLPAKDVYFTHSFHFRTNQKSLVIATTPHCGGFVSVIGSRNIRGVQFHPEKSQTVGFQILRNFLAMEPSAC